MLKIKDLPSKERPRERLVQMGADYLSVQELLEIILSKGNKNNSVVSMARQVISKYPTLNHLSSVSITELLNIKGIGHAKAVQIKAAMELGKRLYAEEYLPKSGSIFTTQDAFKTASLYLKNKKKEHLMLFCLDVRSRLISTPEVVSIGILDCSLVHPREIFKSAISHNAAKVLLAHNHPSGDSTPSDADYEVTKTVYKASGIVGIELIDHVIVGSDQYCSIRENRPEIFSLEQRS